jgi:hypothetical protein
MGPIFHVNRFIFTNGLAQLTVINFECPNYTKYCGFIKLKTTQKKLAIIEEKIAESKYGEFFPKTNLLYNTNFIIFTYPNSIML